MNTCVPQREKYFSVNSNYTYIIASIPFLTRDFRPETGNCADILAWIRSQLEGRDKAQAEFVESLFEPDNLNGEFYSRAFSSKSRFVREFFGADLRLRNAKVRYLNASIGRPSDKDILEVEGAAKSDDAGALAEIFAPGKDLLERERMMDAFLWGKADELTRMSSFSLDNVLAVTAKLCIIKRWLTLDDKTGKEMLRRLVGDLRGTYGKIEFQTE